MSNNQLHMSNALIDKYTARIEFKQGRIKRLRNELEQNNADIDYIKNEIYILEEEIKKYQNKLDNLGG